MFGYQGDWAWVDLTNRTVRIEPADVSICADYVGGRGVQARLMHEHLSRTGRLTDPLSPANRLVIGSAALNDSGVATASRGSCSFISPMTRSPLRVPWVPDHQPLHGLLTHSSAGGVFHNMLKRTGLDQLIIDGRADRPVRLVVTDEEVRIVDAEEELFETVRGSRIVRTASAITGFLTAKHPGSSTVCIGPAGWNGVAFACLTNDHHRNFGRGGAGAVFGSKDLVAITVHGQRRIRCFDENDFTQAAQEIDRMVRSEVWKVFHGRRSRQPHFSRFADVEKIGDPVDQSALDFEQALETADEVRACLECLPEELRQLVIEAYTLTEGELSSPGIRERLAKNLGISRNAVDQRLSRAIRSIRERMRKDPGPKTT